MGSHHDFHKDEDKPEQLVSQTAESSVDPSEKIVEEDSKADGGLALPQFNYEGRKDAPGKIRAGGVPEPQLDQTARLELVRDAIAAVRSEDSNDLPKSLALAFEGCNGDFSKFQKFGCELAEQMKKLELVVKVGRDGLSIHRIGSRHGVEFVLNAVLEFDTAKMKADIHCQAYDWVTKKDVKSVTAEEVIVDLKNKGAGL